MPVHHLALSNPPSAAFCLFTKFTISHFSPPFFPFCFLQRPNEYLVRPYRFLDTVADGGDEDEEEDDEDEEEDEEDEEDDGDSEDDYDEN